jgi:hypothetical protein
MFWWFLMRMQASLEFLLIGSAVAAMSLFLILFYSRNLFSQTSALAGMANASANASYYAQPSFLLDYPAPSTTVMPTYSVAITRRSEKLGYEIGTPSYVANLTEFSHCTEVGFYGHPFNVSWQCGTANAWDYLAGYDCPRSGAYCIIPHNTSYGTSALSSQREFIFNITLAIGSPYGTMSSQISSLAANSPVLLNGQTVGYASVAGVSSADPSPSVTLMSHMGNYSIANQTYLQLYNQYKNTLYPMLAFYNGTGVDGSTQLSIQEAVNSFSSSQIRLVGSSGGAPPCAVSAGYYLCNATYPFAYLINVTLSPSVAQANQTLYYLGSVISIRA